MISGARRILNWMSPEDANTNGNDNHDAPTIPNREGEESGARSTGNARSPEPEVVGVRVVRVQVERRAPSDGNGGVRNPDGAREENTWDRDRNGNRESREEDRDRRPEDELVAIPPRVSDVSSASDEVSQPPPPVPIVPAIPVRENSACPLFSISYI